MERNCSESYDCFICMSIMTEPIKLSCMHIICLNCIDKIIINGDMRCPMDRKEFNFESDLQFDKFVFEKNLNFHPIEFKEKALKILEEREMSSGLVEFQLSYGNEHFLLSERNNNNHKWKVFVKLFPVNKKKTKVINNFQKLANLKGIMYHEIKNEDTKEAQNVKRELSILKFNKNEFEDAIIKKVIFKLHPTFLPPVVEITNWPFEVTRIGWGTFNIEITIEFQDYLNIEKLILDHNLNFNDEISSYSKIILIDFNKQK